MGNWDDIAGFIYEGKVKGECILMSYKKNSYLISSQLDQDYDMKIDVFWRIGFIYEWNVKGECILISYKKNSYLISSQLDQVYDMKIDVFWRIAQV